MWFPALLTIMCLACGLAFGAIYGKLVFDKIDVISIVSVILFFFVALYSVFDDDRLSLILPFVFIAFPTAVNNIFPGVYLETEQMGVIYPLICHPEIYLLLAIIVKGSLIDFSTDGLTYLLSISFIITSIINMVACDNMQQLVLLVAGQYPVRLLILTALMLRSRSLNYELLLIGFCLAILFLAFESTVFTLNTASSSWSSGSLGINTLGNVMGIMSMVLLYYVIITDIQGLKRKLMIICAIVGVLIAILTETRVILLAMIAMAVVILYPIMSKRIKIIVFLIMLGVVIYIVRTNLLFHLEGKMDIGAAMDAIDYSKSAGLEIRYSEATTSLITRLSLWETSFKMFFDRPLTGIGWNLFNILKYKYGFETIVIIDPHNGYISFLCQLGIWAFLWWYYLYFRSWMIFLKSRDSHLKAMAVFNVGMSICELTNAGSYKYSVLSMLILVSVYINMKYREEAIAEIQ